MKQKIQAEEIQVGDEILACMRADNWLVDPVVPPLTVESVSLGHNMVFAHAGQRRLDMQSFAPVYIRERQPA